ncbi:hypothetical protein Tco_0090221 [Tanacetum coccineum]
MGGAILTLVSRVKKLEKTVKKMRDTRLVVDASTEEGDVDIQDDIDLDGLSRMASAALGQPAVPSDDVEEREEEEVPLRCKRSAYHRAMTAFSTPAFVHPEPAGLSGAADKGKAPLPELDIPAEFVAEDAQARKRLEEEQASERLVQRLRAEDLAQEDLPNVSEERAKELDDLMMRMTETDWLNLMMQVGSNPALARELLGADVNEGNFIERMTAVKERKKRALADLRYRALKGKPLKKSELVEEYEYICRRLEKDRLLSAQYNLFRPKPAISEPPSKRQRVERGTSQPSSVPAATTPPADDPDSAGGGSSHPAGSATPLSGSAAPNTTGGAFGAIITDSTVTTTAAMDSAGSYRNIGVSPFADSAVGCINEFFLCSDEDEQIGMSRVAADPDSDDEVLAEIIFRGKSISGDGVVLVDKLPDDEIVDPRVKVETVSDYASSPPRNRRKHLGVRSDDCLWDKPVEDFFSSESESDDDMENYIPPLPYGKFKDWEMVSCPPGNSYIHVYYQQNRRRKYFTYLKQLLPHVYREDILLLRRRMNRYFRLNPEVNIGLDLWRDVNMLCQSLHSDDVEDFWRTQDEWIVSSWKLYPKSSVHVLDLTNGKTVYMFVDKFYPIRATLLERMLRHRLTVPPSYCRDVVVAGNIIQTVQTGLRQSYECLASAPIACQLHDMVFSSPWLNPRKSSGYLCKRFDWKLLFFDSAVSIDAADLDAASTVFAACIVSAGICFCCYSILLLREDLSRNLELTESTPIVPADYVSAGHVGQTMMNQHEVSEEHLPLRGHKSLELDLNGMVVHSFVAKNEPDQDMIMKTIDQGGDNVKTVKDKAQPSLMQQKTRLVRLRRYMEMMYRNYCLIIGGDDVSKAAAEFGLMGIFLRHKKKRKTGKLSLQATIVDLKSGRKSSKNFGKCHVPDLEEVKPSFLMVLSMLGDACVPPHHWNHLYAHPIQSVNRGNTGKLWLFSWDKVFRTQRTYASMIQASRPRPKDSQRAKQTAVILAGRPNPAGCQKASTCFWLGRWCLGYLLLRPQQVTLWRNKDHNFGGQRVLVDLINPHVSTLMIPTRQDSKSDWLGSLKCTNVVVVKERHCQIWEVIIGGRITGKGYLMDFKLDFEKSLLPLILLVVYLLEVFAGSDPAGGNPRCSSQKGASIHPQSQILGASRFSVLSSKRAQKSKFGLKVLSLIIFKITKDSIIQHHFIAVWMQQFFNHSKYGNHCSHYMMANMQWDKIDFGRTRGDARVILYGIKQDVMLKVPFLYGELKKKCMSLSIKGFEDPYFQSHVLQSGGRYYRNKTLDFIKEESFRGITFVEIHYRWMSFSGTEELISCSAEAQSSLWPLLHQKRSRDVAAASCFVDLCWFLLVYTMILLVVNLPAGCFVFWCKLWDTAVWFRVHAGRLLLHGGFISAIGWFMLSIHPYLYTDELVCARAGWSLPLGHFVFAVVSNTASVVTAG